MASLTLTGCGYELYAGSATNIDPVYEEAYLNRNTNIHWYDGEKENSGTFSVNVETGKNATEILKHYDTSFIPFDEYAASSWIAINIESTDDNIPQVKITSKGSNQLVFNGIEHNGIAYKLADGWFGCAVPNGMTEFDICIGDKKISVEINKDTEPVTISDITMEEPANAQ